MTPSRASRSPYPVTWAALICGVLCAATVLAAAQRDSGPVAAAAAATSWSASGDPLLAGAWLFA